MTENTKLKQQLVTFKDSSVVSVDQVNSLSKQLGTYKDKLAKLQLEHEAATAKHSNDALLHSNVHNCLVDTQQKLANKDILLSEASSQLETTKHEKEQLAFEKNNLKGNLTKLNAEVVDYKTRLTEIEYDLSVKNQSHLSEISELKSELSHRSKKSSFSQKTSVLDGSEYSDLKTNYANLQEKLKQSEKLVKQVNVLNSAERARRVVNVKEIADLNQKLANMNEEFIKLNTDLLSNQSRVSDLQSELSCIQRTLASTEILVENHNILISSKDNKIGELESAIKVKDMEIKTSTDEIAELEYDEINAKNKLTILVEELRDTQQQLNIVVEDKARIATMVVSLEKENKQLKYEAARLSTETDSAPKISEKMVPCNEEGNDKIAEFEKIKSEYLLLKEKHVALEKSFHIERVKKEQVVNKLAEISHLKDNSGKHGKKSIGNFEVKFKKKEMDFKRLEQDFKHYREKFESDKKSLTKHIDELALEKNKIELELCSVKAIATQSRSDIMSVNSLDFDVQKDWILYTPSKNIKRHGWNKKIVIFNEDKLIFYTEKNREVPEMVIDIGKVYHVRPVSQGDVYRANESDVPKIFHIIYANEGIIRKDRASFKSFPTLTTTDKSGRDASGTIYYNGHEMMAITYRKGDISCDLCHKNLSSLFNPPPAMECKICHVKLHREHVDNNEYKKQCSVLCQKSLDVTDLLLLAPNVEEQKKWLSILSKSIKERGYVKSCSDAKSLTLRK